MEKLTVLVVDDEAMVRRVVTLALTFAGFQVLTAAGISEAEAICRTHSGSIDVLLMDVMLGPCHGFDGVPCLASHRSTMKVVYMSGYPGQLLFESREIQAQFIAKPFQPEELVQAVRQALGPGTYPSPAAPGPEA